MKRKEPHQDWKVFKIDLQSFWAIWSKMTDTQKQKAKRPSYGLWKDFAFIIFLGRLNKYKQPIPKFSQNLQASRTFCTSFNKSVISVSFSRNLSSMKDFTTFTRGSMTNSKSKTRKWNSHKQWKLWMRKGSLLSKLKLFTTFVNTSQPGI